MLALLALEAANRPGGPMARHCLILGLAYLPLFGGAHLLVIHQSPAHLALGPLRVRGRLLIELFAIAVADTWAWVPAGRGLRDLPLWRRIQPCFLEVSLVGAVVMILTEIAELWRPLAWTLLALALITPALRGRLPLRTQLYSVFFYWLAVATVVGTLAQLESPSALWHQRPQAIGLLVVGLQGGYVAASHRWLDLAALCQLGGLPLLGWLGNRIANRRNAWLYYPLFAAVAVFFGIRYDRSLLTLLWSGLAFAIHLLGALLRERSFRPVALVGLGICLLRLLAVDMAQADLGLRGLVFIGVGLLMVAMNALASRFRSRFE